MQDRPESILVFRSAALGDFILACPALAMVRKTFPDQRIVLLTTASSNKAIRDSVSSYSPDTPIPWVELATPHLIDETIVLDRFDSLAHLSGLRKRLQAHSFSRGVLLLDPCAPWLGRLKKLALLKYLLGRVPVIGWRGPGSLNGNRRKLKSVGLLRHHVHGPLQFLHELSPSVDYSEKDVIFDLRVPASEQEWVSQWISANAIDAGKLIAVAPGSVQPHKQWPIERFAEVVRRFLSLDPDINIVVLGTLADSGHANELARIAPHRVFPLAGQARISRSAAVLSRCRLLVGNDGGAMHLGDAVGCKVVSIVPGIEYPDSIEPWNNRLSAVRHAVPCAPCYSFQHCPEGHNRCMKELPVEKVWTSCMEAFQAG